MENSWNGLKIEIYDFHQYSCSPEKVFHCELEPFGNLLSPIHGHTYSKCIFTIQGVLKMKKMPWYGLKIEINDFNQYNCSPEKVCLYEVEFLGALCPKYLDILFQSVFSLNRAS